MFNDEVEVEESFHAENLIFCIESFVISIDREKISWKFQKIIKPKNQNTQFS